MEHESVRFLAVLFVFGLTAAPALAEPYLAVREGCVAAPATPT